MPGTTMSAQDLSAGRDNILVQGDLHYSGAPAPSQRLPVFEVPLADRRSFWGRQDSLEELDRAWRRHGAVALTQTLAGMGGVGKSQLAAQFAYRHRDQLDVAWWVSCTPPAGGELDARALARARFGALGPFLGLPPGDDVDASAAAVRRWLETTDKRWLVVFDDAPEWSVIEALIPQAGPGLCLVTSRNPRWDLADAVIDVGVFDLDTAAGFLQARAGIDDHAGARPLAEALGGLALALEQAGAFLAHSPVRLGFADYLDALRQRGLRVFAGGRVDDYDHVVATVWEQSFEAVLARSPRAAELLELFGVLAAAPLPTEVLTADRQDETFDVAAALEELAAYSLASSASGAVVVHQLVARAVAERMGLPQTSAARAWAVRLLDAAFPTTLTDPATWATATALVPHVLALFSARSDVGIDVLRPAARAAFYLWAQGDYGSARQIEEEVLAAYREVLGELHPHTLRSAHDLGLTLWAQGELGLARQCQEEVLVARQEVLGEHHSDTLKSAHNLALTLWSQGELGAARELLEKVLAARRETLGKRHPATLSSANNLAAILWAQGELGAARELHEEVLAGCREVLGEYHPDTLASANDLALTLRAQGELGLARELLKHVLAGRRDVLGDHHPNTLASADNLVATLTAMGESTAASRLKEEFGLE